MSTIFMHNMKMQSLSYRLTQLYDIMHPQWWSVIINEVEPKLSNNQQIRVLKLGNNQQIRVLRLQYYDNETRLKTIKC